MGEIRNKSRTIGLKLYTYLFLTFFTLFWGLYTWLSIPLFSYITADLCIFSLAVVYSVAIILMKRGRIQPAEGAMLFVLLFLLVCAGVVNTGFVAPEQPFNLTLLEAFPYLSVCLEAFVLSRLIQNEKDLSWFLRTVEGACLAICCFSIFQFLLYPELIIFPVDALPYRNGLPRIYVGGGSILTVGCLVSAGNLFDNKRTDLLSWVNLILSLLTLALVRQARTNTAYLLAVLVLTVISRSNIPLALRRGGCLCLSGCMILLFALTEADGAVMEFARSDDGIRARLTAIRFFGEKFKEYPVLGMGFITSSGNLDPVSYALLCSPTGYHFDRSDVGVIGVANMFGICGVLWYFLYLRRLYRNSRPCADGRSPALCKLLFWYMIISMINLMVMTMQMTPVIAFAAVITFKQRTFYQIHEGKG